MRRPFIMGVEGKERTVSEHLAHASLGQSEVFVGSYIQVQLGTDPYLEGPNPARAQIAPRACRKYYGRVWRPSRRAEDLVALLAGRGSHLAGNRIW